MAVDWFSVVMRFGTLSSLSVRMWTPGLVRLLFVTRKENGWDMVPKTMKYVTGMAYWWVSGWWNNSSRV